MLHTHIRTPKLLLLLASFILAYVLYWQGTFDLLPSILHGRGYISLFLGGVLFSFGFTSPFAVAIFVAMADTVHPVSGALVAGAGAMLADVTIFQFVRMSFDDELKHLKMTRFFLWITSFFERGGLLRSFRSTIVWSVAGLLIASPLPDEVGVSMLSGITDIHPKLLALVCYVLNAAGVFLILLTARALGAA